MMTTRLQTFISKHNLNPYMVFENLHITLPKATSPKTQMINAVRDLAGIYIIINLINGKFYVGVAHKGNFSKRFNTHCVSLTGNVLLAQAVSKYGLENFAFLILEVVPPQTSLLKEKEQFYLDLLTPPYNILPESMVSSGYKHTLESRAKISQANRNRSPEVRARASANRLLTLNLTSAGRRRKSISAIARISKGIFGWKAKPIIVTNMNGDNLREFSSVKLAAQTIQCSPTTLNLALKGNGILKDTWIVKYKE